MATRRRWAAILAAIGLAVALSAFHLSGSDQPRRSDAAVAPSADRSDIALMAATVARVRAGEPYYAAMAAELSARGYPRSFFLNWRLPTLTVIEGALPSMTLAQVALMIFGISAAWLLTTAFPRAAIDARLATFAASLTMLPWWLVSARVVVSQEVWAGELIALSLGLWPRRPWVSLLAGLAAALVRELAVIYLVAMVVAAVVEGRRREAVGWAAAMGVLVVALALHARAAAPFIQPSVANNWIAVGGADFVLATLRANPLALLLPTVVLAVVAAMAFVGLWMWSHPAGRRIAVTVSLFAVTFLVVGRADNWYWGFLIAPIWPLGLIGFGTALLNDPASPPRANGSRRAPSREARATALSST